MERLAIDLEQWRDRVGSTRRAMRAKGDDLRAAVLDLARGVEHSLGVLDRSGRDPIDQLESVRSISLAVADVASLAAEAHQAGLVAKEAEAHLATLCRSAQHLKDLEAAQDGPSLAERVEKLVESVAEQQAMRDDSWRPELSQILREMVRGAPAP